MLSLSAGGRVAEEWRLADDLGEQLRGYGDVYVTVLITSGRFPLRRKDGDNPGYVVVQRGPVLPGVDDTKVASLGRDFERVLGYPAAEPS